MKSLLKTFLAIAVLAFSVKANAQLQTPAASPACELEQTVGLTEVEIEYSRPAVRGRTIFAKDGLVPFGEVWRTGANSATMISFSEDVKLGGQALEAGSYAILTKPDAKEWEFMFYPYESGNWTSYVDKTPAATVKAKSAKLSSPRESMTFDINDITAEGANIYLKWADTKVSFPLEVMTDEAVMASIDKVMAGPTANDYFAAASYYHEAGKDLNQALTWVQKANAENPRYWMLRREALILADLGRKEEAIATATKSMELAKEAGNNDYIRMNEASIKEWSM